jgi:hypothetical protein
MIYPIYLHSLINNNSTASGIAKSTIKQHQSKAINKWFYWIHDRICQGHFTVEWKKGSRMQQINSTSIINTGTMIQFSAQLTFSIPKTQDKINLTFLQKMIQRDKPEEGCVQQTLSCCLFGQVSVCCFSWYPDSYP